MGIVYKLDTPSLLLDYQKLIKNMVNIADFAKKQGISYRPHIKTHKSVKIAQLQLEAGAIGITCAKISEAEVMAAAGIKDILIAYPISSPDKIKRVIDHPEVIIERLSEEHGVGSLVGETNLKLNDKVQIIPNHACTVVNQFAEYVVHENGQGIDVWKVDARGMVK
jgi:D-serine deaminase-like pyridoxal phosphate-dependent protein